MYQLKSVFWSRWIVVLSLFLVIYGLAMIFTTQMMNTTLVVPLLYHTEVMRNAYAATVEPQLTFITIVTGLLGTVVVGYAILIGWIGLVPFRNGERWAWNALAMSVTVWATLEFYFKLVNGLGGVGLFAHFGFMVAFWIPLLATYRDFYLSSN